LPSGGAKRMMFELIRRLAGQHEFHVFSLSTANHEFCDIRPYVKSHTIFEFKETALFHSPFGRLNQFIRWMNLNRIIKLNKKIGLIIEDGNFDFLWVNPCQMQNSPAILNFVKKTPKLFLCQEPLRVLYEEMPNRPYDKKINGVRKLMDFVDPLRRLFFQKLKKNDRSNIQQANLILVNSDFMRATVSKVYPVQPKINYAGVDINFFLSEGYLKENFLLSVGSLTPLKGFDFLMVGISDQLLKDLYNKATLTLYAPIREPFGLVAIESMACGTPVVGVAEGGLLETIRHQETGLLTPRNEQEFSLAIQTLLSNPQKIDEFGKAGVIDVAQNWSWERSANNFEKHFQFIEKNMGSNKILHMESVN
jgi:glycosyltransferase involved in cell wall biosynthesis